MKLTPIFLLAGLLLLGACSSKSSKPSAATKPAYKPAPFSTEGIHQDLQNGGVQGQASHEQVQMFFKNNPKYHLCKDYADATLAVLRNKAQNPDLEDQYIVIAYRNGKVSSLDIAPPQYSAANVVSDCQAAQ